MELDDDYTFFVPKEMQVAAAPAQTAEETVVEPPAEASGQASELPLVAWPIEQTSPSLPETAEGLVEPVLTKTSKRKRKKHSRHHEQKETAFVDDKEACATLLYNLKLSDVSADIPPVSELEESDAYRRYARSVVKTQALANKIIVDYQSKLNEARKAPKDVEQMDVLRADFEKQCKLNARLAEQLRERKEENKELQASLSAKSDEAAEAKVELRALGEYTQAMKVRFDRLRDRLTYLNKVKTVAKRADQARATFKAMQSLVNIGVPIPQGALDKLESDATGYEAEFKEIDPVGFEEGDLAPLQEYVPVTAELGELLRLRVPSEPEEDEHMQDAARSEDEGEEEDGDEQGE